MSPTDIVLWPFDTTHLQVPWAPLLQNDTVMIDGLSLFMRKVT